MPLTHASIMILKNLVEKEIACMHTDQRYGKVKRTYTIPNLEAINKVLDAEAAELER